MVLRPSDKGEPWAPRRVFTNFRSAALEDFSAEQVRVLAELAAQITHPGLNARLADIAWSVGPSVKLSFLRILDRNSGGARPGDSDCWPVTTISAVGNAARWACEFNRARAVIGALFWPAT
jgi:hypothetical protein